MEGMNKTTELQRTPEIDSLKRNDVGRFKMNKMRKRRLNSDTRFWVMDLCVFQFATRGRCIKGK